MIQPIVRNEQELDVRQLCEFLGCTPQSPAASVTEDIAGNLHVQDSGYDAETILLKLRSGDTITPPDPFVAHGIIRVRLTDGTQFVIRKGT